MKEGKNKIIAIIAVRNMEHLSEILSEDHVALLSAGETLREIKFAIEKIRSGQQHISTRVSKTLLADMMRNKKSMHMESMGETLTRREKEIALMLAEGNSTVDIAAKLFLSKQTVSTHRKHILKKLGFKNTTSLVHHILNHPPK